MGRKANKPTERAEERIMVTAKNGRCAVAFRKANEEWSRTATLDIEGVLGLSELLDWFKRKYNRIEDTTKTTMTWRKPKQRRAVNS